MGTLGISVGDTIKSLFPEGFLNREYVYMALLGSHAESEAVLNKIFKDQKSISLSSVIKSQREKEAMSQVDTAIDQQAKTMKSRLSKWNEDLGKNVPEAYLLPPLSPFDLFAIVSQLLVQSGAYHHFETAFDVEYKERETHLGYSKRVKEISASDRRVWNEAGQLLQSLPFVDSESEYDEEAFNSVVAEIVSKLESLFKPRSRSLKTIDYSKLSSVSDFWHVLLKHWDSNVFNAVNGRDPAPEWWKAALALLAVSDKAAEEVGFGFSKEQKCWVEFADLVFSQFSNIDEGHEETGGRKFVESISFANRDIINILPKSSTAQIGCTLRSLSVNLAKLPPRSHVRVGWSADLGSTINEGERDEMLRNPVFNMLLVPYPYTIHSYNFKTSARYIGREKNFGSFRLEVNSKLTEDLKFVSFVADLIDEAKKTLGHVHAVVLPELAISKSTAESLLKNILSSYPDVEMVCFGVRERMLKKGDKEPVPSNGAFMAYLLNGDVKRQFFHFKHHRWRIDANQIEMYDLSPSLDASHVWWEDTHLTERCLPFIVVRNKWSITTLICEDLARTNPAKEVVEAIGPNLIISLLMDGPQINERWPSRYATVLADDPGSSVLSVSSFGLIQRYNKNCERLYKYPQSRSFALWRDDRGRSQQIELEEGSHAVAITLNEFPKTTETLYGRTDKRGTSLRLTGTRQVSLGKDVEFPSWSTPM